MDSTTSNQVNKCKNCGAELGPVVNGEVACGYCGSVFKTEEPAKPATSVGTIGFGHRSSNMANPSTNGNQPRTAPVLQPNPLDQSAVPRFDGDFSLKIPSRGKIFLKYFIRGLIIWIVWGFIRGLVLPALLGSEYAVDSDAFNNIIISPALSAYRVLRGVLLVIVFPGLMCTVFYESLTAKYHRT